MSRARSWATIVGLGSFACVAERAGYDDVRGLTAERLSVEVRWHEPDTDLDAPSTELLSLPLDAERAARVALLNNRSLQAAFEELGVARGELLEALRLPNPSVGAALRYGADDRPEVDLDATISLSELLFMPVRRGVGEAGLDAALLEVAGRAINLAFEARSEFIAYQAAVQRLDLARTILGALRASADMASGLHQAGNISDLWWQSEQAAYHEARISHARAEADAQEQREQLNAVMGLSGPAAATWTAVATLPEPSDSTEQLKDVERRALARSLDLESCKRRFEAARRRANLSRFEGWFPDLSAGVSAERAEAGWALGPMAELEVPLFYQGQGETHAALSEMRREQRLASHTAVLVRSRARALAVRLLTAEQGVRFYRETLLPLRRQVVEQTQLQYNAMNAGVFQLLQAKRDEIGAALDYVELLEEYWTVHTELGRLLAGRLAENRSSLTAALGEKRATAPTAH